jgi:hypothetical protein
MPEASEAEQTALELVLEKVEEILKQHVVGAVIFVLTCDGVEHAFSYTDEGLTYSNGRPARIEVLKSARDNLSWRIAQAEGN